MNIDQTTEILQKRERNYLDIGYMSNGEKRIVYRKYEPDSNFRKLIIHTFQDYQVPELFIDIYAPNGSSFKFDRSVSIRNEGNYAPAPQQFAGLAGAMPDQFTAYIIREKEEKISEKAEVIRELKDQQKLDQDTIRELRDKNFELERTVKFQAKEFELQKAEDNLLRENEKKNSLEGIVEKVTSNEKLMELAGAFMMAKMQPQPSASVMDSSALGGFEIDPSISHEKKQMIKNIAMWLKEQEDGLVKKVYSVFNHLSMNPKLIDSTLEILQNEPVQKAHTN